MISISMSFAGFSRGLQCLLMLGWLFGPLPGGTRAIVLHNMEVLFAFMLLQLANL